MEEAELIETLKKVGVDETTARRVIVALNVQLLERFEKWRANYEARQRVQPESVFDLLRGNERVAIVERQGNVLVVRPFLLGPRPSSSVDFDVEYIRTETAERKPLNLFRRVQ